METNVQREIKDALKVLAVIKETPSPDKEEELGKRIRIDGVTTESSEDSQPSESPRNDQKKSGPGRGGEQHKGSEAGSGTGSPKHPKGNGVRISDGGTSEPIYDGVFNITVCENNPDESVRGDPCYVMLGETGGGKPMPELNRDRKFEGSLTVGKDDDGGQPRIVISQPDPAVKHKKPPRLTKQTKATTDTDDPNAGSSAVDDSMTPDDIREAFGDGSKPRNRRLGNLEHASASLPAIVVNKDPIKRGIGGSTTSHGVTTVSGLSHGVTPSAPELEQCPDGRYANAANVQRFVHNASVTQAIGKLMIGPSSNYSEPQHQNRRNYQSSEIGGMSSIDGSFRGSMADADSSVMSETPFLMISEVLDNQRLILDKLKLLDEIKHEVEGIKKTLIKHSLVLSTLEGQLSSVMIAVPSFGTAPRPVDQNPDLRPLLGRDKGRGAADISKARTTTVSFDEPTGGRQQRSSNVKVKLDLDKNILPPPIDPDKSSATGFKPTNTQVSKEVILALIDTRIKDKETNMKMKRLLSTAKTGKELNELHRAIMNVLKRQ
nr:MAG: phosphoprotein [Jingmen rodent narmovirus 1]